MTSRSRCRWHLSGSLAVLTIAASATAAAQSPPPTEPPPPPPAEVAPPPAEPPAKPPAPPPPAATTANKGKLTFKGFVSATLFMQDTGWAFGDGQNAEYPLPTTAKGDDPWFIDGDVRNTRLNLTWEGPTDTVLPRLGAQVEADFFAPAGGGGGFGNAQPVPRLRTAFADLGIGDSTLRFGQDWAPWFGNVPVSLSHIAFPLGYGSAGMSGWRFIGLFWSMPLTPKDAALGAKITIAVMRNAWPGATGQPSLTQPNQGSAGIPQIEGRVDINGSADTVKWSLFAVGHFDQKDLSDPTGRGDTASPGKTLSGTGGEFGAKVQAGPLLVQATGYFAHSMAQEFTNLTQFGDISGFGVWGQVGYDVTPNISLFGFFGFDKPNHDDVIAAIPVAADTAAGALPRLQNLMADFMVRYKVGPYAIGLEYLFDKLDFHNMAGDTDVSASQFALSVNYAF